MRHTGWSSTQDNHNLIFGIVLHDLTVSPEKT